jgi:phage/plasmid-like protein (TIGR03299 family)
MSMETREWLSTNTLIGFTAKRGNAWHYREGDKNHYADAVPIEDVRGRLFNWTAQEQELFISEDFMGDTFYTPVPGFKSITRSDTNAVLGIFKDRYQIHQYEEWLLGNVGKLLSSDLHIGSAGLLKNGAVAWVSVETPENIVTPEGVKFRPNFLAVTSMDGTIATTYKNVVTNVVCDNTMAMALREGGSTAYRVKHTARSLGRITDAREALGIMFDSADEFSAEVAQLTATAFTSAQFEKLVAQLAPIKDDETPRVRTMMDRKRGDLFQLWNADERVAPWKGTAFGAWQAVNTYQHHYAEIRKGAARAERNMLRAVTGQSAQADVDTVQKVLALV